MTPVTRPRGPLPARVYWTRRLLVVAVAFALVFGLAHVFGTGGGGSGPSAEPVGADPTGTGTTSPAAASIEPQVVISPSVMPAGNDASLPQPSGACADSDVVATPTIADHAYGGRPVVFAVNLTTQESLACTWTVSPRSLVVKVTSGADNIWSTQQCVGAILKQQVVVRRDTMTTVDVAWTGQRSDDDCSRATTWVEPGTYHVVAAAFGAEPVDTKFVLLDPPRATVTATPSPSGSPTASPSDKLTKTEERARQVRKIRREIRAEKRRKAARQEARRKARASASPSPTPSAKASKKP